MNFPWKPSPQKQMVRDMKLNLSNQIVTQFSGQMFAGACSVAIPKIADRLVTVLGWKKVPLVTPDPAQEKDDQDAIYNGYMSRINGDRSIVHGVPDPIEMKAFTNDKLPPEEREHLYETIDIINEAMDIERTGRYRTRETMEEDNRQAEEQTHTDTSSFHVDNVLGIFMQMIQQISAVAMNMAVSVLSVMITCKLLDYIQKLKI